MSETTNNPSFFIKAYGRLVKLFTSPARFVYLGGEIEGPALILSNHSAAAGPLTWHYWFNKPKRFWATHENTEGVKAVYRYLADIYFSKKRHINAAVSKVLAFFASPFISLFFKYIAPIPTYKDDAIKLVGTLRQSLKTIKKGESIVIFPEDSSEGYFDKPKRFFSGFVVLGERLLQKGVDIPVVVSYFSNKKHKVIMDKPILFSALKKLHNDRENLAEAVRQRLNELADMV